MEDKTQKEKIREEWKDAVETANAFTDYVKMSGSRELNADAIADWWLKQIDLAIKETEERIVREIDSTIETTSICSMHKDWNEDCKICRATTMPRSMLLSLKEKLLSTL